MSKQLINRSASEEEMEKMFEEEVQPKAQWKVTQQNTFTRWVNQQLKTVDLSIENLEVDFEDGLKLIRLVEVLSGHLLGKHNKKVAFRSQKLGNNSLALSFLENEENIKLVNIDSTAIVDRNLKLIMGLVWTLIVHYQIANPVWDLPEGEKEQKVVERTPKEKLMMWIRAKLPEGVEFNNFTSDWNSGIVLGALVSACSSEELLKWRSWTVKGGALSYTRTAMIAAERYLDVAMLITAEELVTPGVDEKSVMTYLAQFPQATFTPPLGVVQELESALIATEPCLLEVHTLNEFVLVETRIRDPHANHVDVVITKEGAKVYWIRFNPRMQGSYEVTLSMKDTLYEKSSVETMVITVDRPPVRFLFEEKARVGDKMVFSLQNAYDGRAVVEVVEPDGSNNVLVVLQTEETVKTAEFNTAMEGEHTVNVLWEDKSVGNSPFKFTVTPKEEEMKVSPAQVLSIVEEGDGTLMQGHPIEIRVNVKGAKPEIVEAVVDTDEPTEGSVTVPVEVVANLDGTFSVFFIPTHTVVYKLKVLFDGIEVGTLEVPRPLVNISQIRIEGIRCDGGYATVGECRKLTVNPKDLEAHGKGLVMTARYGGGIEESIPITVQPDGLLIGEWKVKTAGVAKIHVTFDNEFMQEVPISVRFPPANASACHVQGPGMYEAVVGQPNWFAVDTKTAGEGELRVTVKGPGELEPKVVRDDDAMWYNMVQYTAMVPGVYQVEVTYGEDKQLVPDSPWTITVDHKRDLSKIKLECDHGGVITQGDIVELLFDASQTAIETLETRCEADSTCLQMEKLDERHYVIRLTLDKNAQGMIPLEILYGGEQIEESPLCFKVLAKEKPEPIVLKSESGEAFPEEAIACQPFSFVIHKSDELMNNKLTVHVRAPFGREKEVSVFETQQGRRCTVHFTPDVAGSYHITVLLNCCSTDAEPLSYQIECKPSGHAEKCIVKEMDSENSWKVGETNIIEVDVSKAGEGDLCVVSLEGEVNSAIERIANDLCWVRIVPLTPGLHSIMLVFGGCIVTGGSFEFKCAPPPSEDTESVHTLEKTKELGDEEPVKEQPSPSCARLFKFEVDDNVDIGNMVACVKTPSGEMKAANLKKTDDGSVMVKYTALEEGKHKLSIKLDGEHMEGSPVDFYVYLHSEITVKGDGIKTATAGQPADVVISTSGDTDKELTVQVEGEARARVITEEEQDGKCKFSWTPPVPGEYLIRIRVNGGEVTGSPFAVTAVGEGYKKAVLVVESASEMAFDVGDVDLNTVSAKVKTPSGVIDECVAHFISPNRIGIQFVPRQTGLYMVTIEENGIGIKGSPFMVTVKADELGDASKVVVSGKGRENPSMDCDNQLVVDTRQAGPGRMEVSVYGSSMAVVNDEGVDDGKFHFSYRLTKPGLYVIAVTFNGQHVEDSPFTVECLGEKSEAKVIVPSVDTDNGKVEKVISDDEASWDVEKSKTEDEISQMDEDELEDHEANVVRVKRTGQQELYTTQQMEMYEFKQALAKEDALKAESKSTLATFAKQNDDESPVPARVGNVCWVRLVVERADVEWKLITPDGKTKDIKAVKTEKDNIFLVNFTPDQVGEHVLEVTVDGGKQHVADSPYKIQVGARHEEEEATELDYGAIRHGDAALEAIDAAWKRVHSNGEERDYVTAKSLNEESFRTARSMPSNTEVEDLRAFKEEIQKTPSLSSSEAESYRRDVSMEACYGSNEEADIIEKQVQGVQKTRGMDSSEVEDCLTAVLMEPSYAPNGDENITGEEVEGTQKSQSLISSEVEGYRTAVVSMEASFEHEDEHAIKEHIQKVEKMGGVNWSNAEGGKGTMVDTTRKGDGIDSGVKLEAGDATMVALDMKDMVAVKAGEQSQFMVKTRITATDVLKVQVDGPAKVLLEATKVESGEYVVRYTALEAGLYRFTIKYSGLDVPGSPFTISVGGEMKARTDRRVTSMLEIETSSSWCMMSRDKVMAEMLELKGDAAKVTVEGEGMEKFTVGQHASIFVNTADAGHNLLLVGVQSVGGPCKEVQVKFVGEGRYEVKYLVSDSTQAIVHILYGESSVPGSPFFVHA